MATRKTQTASYRLVGGLLQTVCNVCNLVVTVTAKAAPDRCLRCGERFR